MMPEVEHHHHPHPTGNRRLDLVLPICALFVSVVSLVLAMIHGQAMERMADANARLVQANSWPFLQYATSNIGDNQRPIITIGVVNTGVGPAKVESAELFWQGRPVRNARELLSLCCGLRPGQLPTIAEAHGTAEEQAAQIRRTARTGLSTGLVSGVVIDPREGENFITLPLSDETADVYHGLNAVRADLKFRVCYCSVFDECWISNLRTMTPQAVKTCPAPRVPYSG